MGNVSKSDGELIVYALFNKSENLGNVNHIHVGEGGELPAMKLVSRLRVLCLDIRVLVLLSDYVPTLWVWLSTK